jgi:8-oxo-dGTP pyrophosphatase MutT (NUDIX family)
MKIPANIDQTRDGQYCMQCGSQTVARVYRDGLTYYHCRSCNATLERSLVIDSGIKWWVDEATGEYWHESVGVFVFNEANKALFFQRRIYPFALTIPAGHLDKGEHPEVAVVRELEEETGIKIRQDGVRLFSIEDVIGDECRRGSDNHKWHLYVVKIKQSTNIMINDEGIESVWLSLQEVAAQNPVYPVKYFIEKYGDKLISGNSDIQI